MPIYNPSPESSSSTVEGLGTDFFTANGYLTGLSSILEYSTDIGAFDDSDGTALTITDSVALAGTGDANSWSGWNLGAAQTKLLALTYMQPSLSDWVGLGFHEGSLPTTALQESYQSIFYGGQSKIALSEYTGGSKTEISTDTTMYQDDLRTSAVWGMALYVDGDSNIQKSFAKGATGQWFEVGSATATDHSSFQSLFLWHDGQSARFICPIYLWGA